MLDSDGEKEGIQKGMHEGIQKGIQKGEQLKLISMLRKMTVKGFSEDQIADLLEEDLVSVRKICGILKQDDGRDSDEEVYRKYMEQAV